MNYRLIAILTLTILMLIMFAHKEVSCDAGKTYYDTIIIYHEIFANIKPLDYIQQ